MGDPAGVGGLGKGGLGEDEVLHGKEDPLEVEPGRDLR